MSIDRSIAFPWVWMNGKVIAAAEATVSVFDKSFQIGDGMFDTFRILETCPLEWNAHWKRFTDTAQTLGIDLPINEEEGQRAVQELLQRNDVQNATARVHLSRGIGPRGYSPDKSKHPTMVITLHPTPNVTPGVPTQWKLAISSLPFPNFDLLTRHKTASRLFNVLAKREADTRGFDDAVILDADGNVTEAISSNIFWIKNGVTHTPETRLGILAGTTRDLVLRLCERHGLKTKQAVANLAELKRADGVFLSVSTSGIIEVIEIEGTKLKRHPLTQELHAMLEEHHLRSAERFNSKNTGELSN